jgi:hypothetical protein
LRFPTTALLPAQQGLLGAFDLFAGEYIQNNFSETINGAIEALVSLTGYHTLESLTRRIRGVVEMYNDPEPISAAVLGHIYRSPLLFNRMWAGDFRGNVGELCESCQVLR